MIRGEFCETVLNVRETILSYEEELFGWKVRLSIFRVRRCRGEIYPLTWKKQR